MFERYDHEHAFRVEVAHRALQIVGSPDDPPLVTPFGKAETSAHHATAAVLAARMSVPIGSGGTDGPDLGVARSVGLVIGLGVSSKVAVCWEHRRAHPRRRAPRGGFLRRADGIIDRPEDYLHATDAATRNPRARLARLSEQRRDDFVDGAGGMSR